MRREKGGKLDVTPEAPSNPPRVKRIHFSLTSSTRYPQPAPIPFSAEPVHKLDEQSPDDIDWEPMQMKDAFRSTPEWPPTAFTAAATYQDMQPRSAMRRLIDAVLLQPVGKITLESASPFHPSLIAAIWRRGFQIFFVLGVGLTIASAFWTRIRVSESG
jgi:hypothetical protein